MRDKGEESGDCHNYSRVMDSWPDLPPVVTALYCLQDCPEAVMIDC